MSAACTVHQPSPSLTGPSDSPCRCDDRDPHSILSTRVSVVGQDYCQRAGRAPIGGVPNAALEVNGVIQDFGSLSARSIITGSDGVASVVYTAPLQDPSNINPTCLSVPGRCVTIIATPTGPPASNQPPGVGTDFQTANSQIVVIRLVPPVILPRPAAATSGHADAVNMNIPRRSSLRSTPFRGRRRLLRMRGTSVRGTGTAGRSTTVRVDGSFTHAHGDQRSQCHGVAGRR